MAMGNRHDDLWSGQILGHGGVDPDSPAGGSGPGKSRRPGPLREVVGASALPHPDAPAKRHSYIAKKSAHVVSARMLFIAKARARAISRLAARLKDLEAWDDATAQCFKGWFGSADKSARDTIRARIEAAIKKLKAADLIFIPNKKSDDYAYVFPRDKTSGTERKVFLGAAFWHASELTQAGTLIHEVSHFITVGGTDDVGSESKDWKAVDFAGMNPLKYGGSHAAYGGTRAARLALSHPNLALMNADSFEFFIERRKASVIFDEDGKLDTEGLGDFPTPSGNVG